MFFLLLFFELKQKRKECTVQVLVSFIEIYKDEVFDLLEPSSLSSEIRIREDEQGNTGEFPQQCSCLCNEKGWAFAEKNN